MKKNTNMLIAGSLTRLTVKDVDKINGGNRKEGSVKEQQEKRYKISGD